MKVGSAVNFRLQTMAALDEFALKQSNPCCIVLGSVGASQPQHLDTCNTFPAAPPKGAPKQHRSDNAFPAAPPKEAPKERGLDTPFRAAPPKGAP